MTKTNKRRRVVSILLTLVMLASLIPSMLVPTHAFWDDYDDGFDCPNCDHYHFGSDYMCDCLFCTIDCNYECWVETHCNDCGVCFGDTPYWCETCYKCEECMEDTHCSTCAKCYIGEDDQLCGECHKGPCCSITICDSCGFCDDCANDDSDPMHCSLCNACFGAVDECVDDDDTGVIHCVDCHTACEQCDECLLNQESCEECGLCKECCEINSEGGGCPDGETCVESAEWDEHICPGCDGWVTDKEDEDEFCDICELCRECCEGHKLPCLFEAGYYEAHYMTTGTKERIFPHKFAYDRSYDAVGGGKVDVLYCTVCDYPLYVKSHVHDYGWNWDYTGFGSIYEYTFNIGGSTKTVEQLILESGYAHPEKCKVPGCEEFIMVPHSWGRWNVVLCPDTTGGKGGMEAECSICEYTKTKIDKDNDSAGADHWTKDTALVTVKNGRATRMIVKPGDKIRLYPEERTGQKAIGWKVEYLREYNVSDSMAPVHKKWNTNEAKTLFKLVTDGSALEWGCEIPEFSAMGAPGGGQYFFEPVYAGCDHSGGTTVLNAKAQVCDRKGYTGDTACADCGHVISAGSDIYPPANAGHTGTLQPLYYYGTNNSATTDASHGGKRYNAKSGDCRHRAYEGDYRCSDCGGTVKGETGDFKHSGPFELRDVKTATCTEKGYSGNQYCTACDRIAQKGSSTPSLHEITGNYKLVNEVKPGCTTAGYSGDQQCTGDCGQIFRYGHVIDKLSHDWDGGKPATQGKSEGILYTCQRADCGETRFVRNSAATEYTVTVIKGTASVTAGTPITDKIEPNTVVTVTADAPETGKVFDKWVVLEGNVTLADATKATTTFTMPGNNVKLEATYKDAPPTHTHSYGTDWKYDDTNHWHECECGDKADVAAHSYVWKTDKEATKFKDGSKHEECSVCGAVRNAGTIIPATLGHCWIIDFIISVKDFVIGATKGTVEFIISAFKQIIGK